MCSRRYSKIAGESLFNDGIGVVVFMIILELSGKGGEVTAGRVMQLFMQEAAGGVAFGLVIGVLAYQMLKRVDDYQLEVIITLALSLPPWPERNTILAITYTVVVFSILAQGLSLGKLAQRFHRIKGEQAAV